MTESVDKLDSRLLFTAPWEPLIVRRGDALGMRALADRFADAVAPGLSNRIRDGRWITILSWCLVQSDTRFRETGGRSLETKEEQRDRYAWLRPLELLWVARTIQLTEDGGSKRSLAGLRRVKVWLETQPRNDKRFGLSFDQFRAYRQTGMYGGYRLGFRMWPGMTVGRDGWTPGPQAHKLAKWLDKQLGPMAPEIKPKRLSNRGNAGASRGTRWKHDPVHWWQRHWKKFCEPHREADRKTLPRKSNDFGELPEAKLLAPVLFGSDTGGQRRKAILEQVMQAKATTHLEMCRHLQRSFPKDQKIALMPAFSQLADDGIEVMELIAGELHKSPKAMLDQVAQSPELAEACDRLRESSQAWRQRQGGTIRHVELANQFAESIPTSGQTIDILRGLLQHHEVHGGGLKWFVLRGNTIEPRSPPGVGNSRYRFRLWSLARLGIQCGLTSKGMPRALAADELRGAWEYEDGDE